MLNLQQNVSDRAGAERALASTRVCYVFLGLQWPDLSLPSASSSREALGPRGQGHRQPPSRCAGAGAGPAPRSRPAEVQSAGTAPGCPGPRVCPGPPAAAFGLSTSTPGPSCGRRLDKAMSPGPGSLVASVLTGPPAGQPPQAQGLGSLQALLCSRCGLLPGAGSSPVWAPGSCWLP